MESTLRLLRPFITEKYTNMRLDTLAYLYQDRAEPQILASSFEKIYRLAIVISSDFWGLTECDLASWCLEKLDYCLKTYNSESQFTTYFATVYRNKLREETERLNYQKRKCILESISELIDMGIEDTYNFIEALLPDNLTDKEYQYCILASEGYDNTTIAEILNVSRMTICNIRKSLRLKCATLQNT